jgi:cytochrome c553
MSVLDNWKQWQEFLGDRLQHAETEGMSEGAINNLAFQIGDYLANQVDPKNEQERILSDMWSVADKQEQQAIANIMVKLVKE